MNKQFSPSVQAAMERNEAHAQIGRSRSKAKDIPSVFSDPELMGLKVRKRLKGTSGLPGIGQTRKEAIAAFQEKFYSEDLKVRAGISGTALWLAKRQHGGTDEVDDALQRIDAMQEQGGYRAIVGHPNQFTQRKEPRARLNNRLPKSLIDAVKALIQRRGTSYGECMEFVLRCGLALIDEREKRHQLARLAEINAQ
jgi:hypothetical protein